MQELGQGSKRVGAFFQQRFPNFLANDESGDDSSLTKAYNSYKRKYVKHLSFNPEEENLSMVAIYGLLVFFSNSISASTLEHAPLEAVYIYFDTATYDEIEKDEKVRALFHIMCLYSYQM